MCLALQTLKPPTESPDQKLVTAKCKWLVGASIDLDTVKGEWFPLLSYCAPLVPALQWYGCGRTGLQGKELENLRGASRESFVWDKTD